MGQLNRPALSNSTTWLKDESFRQLILSNWVSFSPDHRLSVAFQFVENFSRLKRLIKHWAVEKRRRDDNELSQIELAIVDMMDMEGGGLLNQESKDTLVGLQGHRNTLLLEKEETWRLKSRALWLACGDENTNFFMHMQRERKL